MTCPIESAVSILKSWSEDRSTVVLLFKSWNASGSFVGRIVVASGSSVAMKGVAAGRATSFVVGLDLVESWSFNDAREASSEEDREALAGIDSGVTATFASHERFSWYRLSSDS